MQSDHQKLPEALDQNVWKWEVEEKKSWSTKSTVSEIDRKYPPKLLQAKAVAKKGKILEK